MLEARGAYDGQGLARAFALLTVLLSLALIVGGAEAPRATTSVLSQGGDLRDYVTSFVSTIPLAGSEGYDPPTSAEASGMRTAYSQMAAGSLSKAASTARTYGYQVIRFRDLPTGRTLDILAEKRRSDNTYAHAWGLYIHAEGTTSRLSVEVPHPVADALTDVFGTATLLQAQGADLFVAGAHRNADADGSADVAHQAGSVFEAIHEAAVKDIVFQPHGFSATDHPDYGDMVVSGGTAPAPALTLNAADALRAAGFNPCVYDGTQCTALGATTNVQGRSARAAGADFLHVEMVRTVREDPALRAVAIDALVPLLH